MLGYNVFNLKVAISEVMFLFQIIYTALKASSLVPGEEEEAPGLLSVVVKEVK